MARMFKNTQSKIQQETPKANMLKKFGGNFRKAFSKKKQPAAQMACEAHVQDVQPETKALPNLTAEVTELPSTENRPDFAPTHVGVDEEMQVWDNTSQELAAAGARDRAVNSLRPVSQEAQKEAPLQSRVGVATSTSQESTPSSSSGNSTPTSMDGLNTDRNTLRRSNSVPPSSSSPATGASSDTLYNTPRHSDTSPLPSLIKFHQAVDEHRGSSGKCQKALAEYLNSGETEKADTEWAALVEWIKIGHQAEVNNLETEHAAKVEKLHQERSEARRRLELRNRELRAMKREMKDLKVSLEETNKVQKEIQPGLNPESADGSDAESVDEDEGGVDLSANNVAPTNAAEDSRGMAVGGVKDADRGRNYAKDDKQETKEPRNETAKDNREHQRALKQQLLEDSAPEFTESQTGAQAVQPAAIGEFETSNAQQAMIDFDGDNQERLIDVKELQDYNRALKANLAFTREVIGHLTTEAESAKGEINNLRGENHFAQLEVGHCNAANAYYRAAAEDDNPARTAHIDGLLKRKDEAHAELERRAAECAVELAEEKMERAVDDVYSARHIQGLKKELAHRVNMIRALTEGKAILKQQNDEILRMFKGKILQNDTVKAFLHDNDTIQKDNALLIKMINERHCYVLEAEKGIADLKAEKIMDEHTAQADRLKQRQLQQSLNGLTYINHHLNTKVEIREEMHEELKEQLERQLSQQADEIQRLLAHGADDELTRRLHSQSGQIAFLDAELTRAHSLAQQWRLRAVELRGDFCPLYNGDEVGDWDAEETRWRLVHAERQNADLQRAVRRLEREGRGARVLEREHDGSKWLGDRAEARREMERASGME